MTAEDERPREDEAGADEAHPPDGQAVAATDDDDVEAHVWRAQS